MSLKNIKLAMKSLSDSQNLPEFYRSDLDVDLEVIEKYRGRKLIWLLRTCGTVLVPVRVGINPVYVTHWLQSDHGQKVIPYVIDTTTGQIEKISYEEAERLITQLPCRLSALQREKIPEQVNSVLATGCQIHAWGLFESPTSRESIGNWYEWRQYFTQSGNRLMSDFLAKAIRLTSERVGGPYEKHI